MTKKHVTPPAKPPTVITLTLPETPTLPRTGQILAQRGTLATICQFTYSSLGEISTALQQAAASLHQLEQNPPSLAPETATAAEEADEEPP